MKNIFSLKKQKIIATIAASIAGVSLVTVSSTIIGFDLCFPRDERPDYSVYPGEYSYQRVGHRLQRTEFFFPAGQSRLKGYFYPASRSKGLVIMVHGFHAGADDYLPIIEYVVNAGYDVFAYDSTGTYDSEGDSVVGLCQALADLDNVFNYLKSTPHADKPKFLIGHSLGGYAASSVLALQKSSNIRACALIAPMNNGYTMIYEKAEQFAGHIALPNKPILDAYQKILFEHYTEYNGVRGINSVDIPVLIAQGLDDAIVTYNGQSITAHKSEITNPNVQYYDGFGTQGDHDNIWHSTASAEYQQRVKSDLEKLKRLMQERGKELTREELVEFYKGVDHALYSQVNKELMERIIALFDGAL